MRRGTPTKDDIAALAILLGDSPEDTEVPSHESAAGALCTDDGTGCCGGCGVALDHCNVCDGTGYHRAGCRESDETLDCIEIVRSELEAILVAQDLPAYRHALARCDTELLAALVSLGLAGRDDLSDAELQAVLAALRPTLRRIATEIYEVGP